MARRSIAMKLTMMNVLVTGIALLLACTGFFAYDQITFRQSLVRTLSAQAQIIGYNSVSALLFNDPQSADQTLSALRNFRNIASAEIFNNNRQLFAHYLRNSNDQALALPLLPPNQAEGHWFRGTHLVLVRQITSEGKVIGFVYLRADLAEINQRLRRYALIALAVLLISLAVAMAISASLRRSVAQPIIDLSQTARRISRDKDFNVRAAPTGSDDELNVLIQSFNEMLGEIQQRDSALQSAHEELEERVVERTHELMSANRELEAFSYSVSHDLRGPLDALNGFTYILQKQYGGKLDDHARDLMDHIRTSGKRMTELIDDLLNLSRITSSAMHSESVNLAEMAREIVAELRRSAPERDVEFTVPERVEAHGDPHLLRIVLENLLQNSWKYTSQKERAHIEFGEEIKDGQSLYFVKDDGIGFDPAFSDRLFRPFQRLLSAAEFPGNGVGLATVKRVIQRHRGEIWAEAALGKGATFHFTLGSISLAQEK